MKYIKGKQTYKLSKCKLIKLDLHDTSANEGDVFHERPWAKRFEKSTHSVLQNDALAFTPFPSWGAVIPSTDSFDFIPMLNSEQLELHPEAWDHYLKVKLINKDGEYIVKEKKS